MEPYWIYDGENGSDVANYRGHIITVKYDIVAENPRARLDHFSFISVNKAEPTPDNCNFIPTGNLYIDIYRYATDKWDIMLDWDSKDFQKAYKYVKKNLIVFPVGYDRQSQSGVSLYLARDAIITQAANRRDLFGAVFISIKEAKEVYGTEKTVEELSDILKLNVIHLIEMYSVWVNNEIKYVGVEPYDKILFMLSTGSEEARKIKHGWLRNLHGLCRQVWGDCSTLNEEVVESIRGVDKQADWLISELDKLDSSQLNPTMKADLLALLSKGEE